MPERSNGVGALVASVAQRALLLALAWWILTEAVIDRWSQAGIAVGIATAASFWTIPRGRLGLRPAGVIRFLPYFLGQSVSGGIDVARRALHPHLPIRPGFIRYALRLPEGPARMLFVASVSLLPGTVSARLEGRYLRVHLLDQGTVAEVRLQALESRVLAVFSPPSR